MNLDDGDRDLCASELPACIATVRDGATLMCSLMRKRCARRAGIFSCSLDGGTPLVTRERRECSRERDDR